MQQRRYFQPPRLPSLYERLGGVYAIAAVVDRFSDALVNNPIVGRDSPNPQLREWYATRMARMPGLKHMRTLWLSDRAGGPVKFVPSAPGAKCPSLGHAHEGLGVTPAEFEAVAVEVAKALEYFKVPTVEKSEVLAIFARAQAEILAHREHPQVGLYQAARQAVATQGPTKRVVEITPLNPVVASVEITHPAAYPTPEVALLRVTPEVASATRASEVAPLRVTPEAASATRASEVAPLRVTSEVAPLRVIPEVASVMRAPEMIAEMRPVPDIAKLVTEVRHAPVRN